MLACAPPDGIPGFVAGGTVFPVAVGEWDGDIVTVDEVVAFPAAVEIDIAVEVVVADDVVRCGPLEGEVADVANGVILDEAVEELRVAEVAVSAFALVPRSVDLDIFEGHVAGKLGHDGVRRGHGELHVVDPAVFGVFKQDAVDGVFGGEIFVAELCVCWSERGVFGVRATWCRQSP